MKYQVILVQTKAIVMDIEAKDSDKAIAEVKKEVLSNPAIYFDSRLGTVQVAGIDVPAVSPPKKKKKNDD